MFEIRTNGMLAETHVSRDEATLAAIRFKEAGRHQLVTVHDVETGHFWTVGGSGNVLPQPEQLRAARRFMRSLNVLT